MSLPVTIVEKLEQLRLRINKDLETGSKSVEFYELFDIFQEIKHELLANFVENLRFANDEDENDIMSLFNSFDPQMKGNIVLIMEIVSKMGTIHQRKDNQKQVMWFEKFRDSHSN